MLDMAVGFWWCSLFPHLHVVCGTSKFLYADIWEEWCLCIWPEQPDAFSQVVSCTSWGGLRMCLGRYLHLVSYDIMLSFGSNGPTSRCQTLSSFKFLYLLWKNQLTRHPAGLLVNIQLLLNLMISAFSCKFGTINIQSKPTTLMSRLHVIRCKLMISSDMGSYIY